MTENEPQVQTTFIWVYHISVLSLSLSLAVSLSVSNYMSSCVTRLFSMAAFFRINMAKRYQGEQLFTKQRAHGGGGSLPLHYTAN